MSGPLTPRSSGSRYAESKTVGGVAVKAKPTIRDWSGWPDDVRDVLRQWNHERRLSFRGESWFGRSATIRKCVDCGDFFRQNDACWMDEAWVCDDCMILRGRQAVAEC